ncbi:hypothetical protein CSUB01_10432 [Colletotrichum sublineola]|uniref:Uncharacterized protein n=1 Tax=Colletotrichum sublineola TaxID=1173701 RepID=A0A066XH60_COLSU|nr:hypothetical protein CSUB01_10432 [Colletotrichum sublineola]
MRRKERTISASANTLSPFPLSLPIFTKRPSPEPEKQHRDDRDIDPRTSVQPRPGAIVAAIPVASYAASPAPPAASVPPAPGRAALALKFDEVGPAQRTAQRAGAAREDIAPQPVHAVLEPVREAVPLALVAGARRFRDEVEVAQVLEGRVGGRLVEGVGEGGEQEEDKEGGEHALAAARPDLGEHCGGRLDLARDVVAPNHSPHPRPARGSRLPRTCLLPAPFVLDEKDVILRVPRVSGVGAYAVELSAGSKPGR